MRKNVFKRVAAGLLSLLTVAVYTPANVADLITGMGGTTIVASAEEDTTTGVQFVNKTVYDRLYDPQSSGQWNTTSKLFSQGVYNELAELENVPDPYYDLIRYELYQNETGYVRYFYLSKTWADDNNVIFWNESGEEINPEAEGSPVTIQSNVYCNVHSDDKLMGGDGEVYVFKADGSVRVLLKSELEDSESGIVVPEGTQISTNSRDRYYILSDENSQNEITLDEAQTGAKQVENNVKYDYTYTKKPVFANSVYAKYTRGNDTGAIMLASVKAENKVYDGLPYDPTTLVKKNILPNQNYSLDAPSYYKVTETGPDTGKYTIEELGDTAPIDKGDYLVSYALMYNGVAARNQYIFAPFTIGSGTVTDRVVTVDLNRDNKISANEIFGGFKKGAGEVFNTTALAEYAADNPDFNANFDFLNSLTTSTSFSEYSIFKFRPLDDLTKLRYTGKEYQLNIYLYSTYTNGGVTKTQMIDPKDYEIKNNKKKDIGTYNATISSEEFIVPEGLQKLSWAITKKQLTDVLVAADKNQDGKIARDELYGDLVWNLPGGVLFMDSEDGRAFLNNVAAWYRAKHSDATDVQADVLFNELLNADFIKKAFRGETPTNVDLDSMTPEEELEYRIIHDLSGKGSIVFNPLDNLKEDFEFDEKPYELAVYPFSIMPTMDSVGYDLEMLKPDDYVVGGTLSNIAAGEYDIQIQSDVYDIVPHLGNAGYWYGLSNESNAMTAVIKWDIDVREVEQTGKNAVDFEVVPEDVETDLDGVGNTPVNVLYTGQPVEIKDYFNNDKPCGLQKGDVLFHINNPRIPEGVELEVKHYFKLAGDDTATWKEGTPTQAGTYQVIGLYNGKVSADKSTAINENYAFYTDEMTLVINQVDMTVQSTASSIYGDKLTVDMNKITIKNSKVDPEGKKISEIADVTAEVVLPDDTAKNAVLGAGTYDLKLTIKAKEGCEEEFKNYKFGTGLNKDGVLIVKDGYKVEKKSVTADMVEFTSQYVKPTGSMVNYDGVVVKFEGYDFSGKTKEIVLEANQDYKFYGATQAVSENEYKMSILGCGENYKGWDKVTWRVDHRDEVEITGKYARVSKTSYDTANKKLSITSRLAVPSNATMTKIGVIATNNLSKKYSLTVDTPEVAGETYVKVRTDVGDLKGINYTWRKSNVEAGDVWYAVPYVCYTIDGKEVIKYGELTEVTTEGNAVVEMASVNYTNATYFKEDGVWKLQNRGLIEVPDGYKIDVAGVCGTNDITRAETMDSSTKTVDGVIYNKPMEPTGNETSLYRVWRKTSVKPNDVWYVKFYATYTDKDGVKNTVYSDVYSVQARGQNNDGTGEAFFRKGIVDFNLQ